MHKQTHPIKSSSMIGHPSNFPDGKYYCRGTFGMDKLRAEQEAERIAKRYNSKTLVTEKNVRVMGEYGIVTKQLYIIWERRK